MAKIYIENLIVEQGRRALSLTCDPDYNILKKIVKYCCDKNYDPIEDLVKGIHDKVLMGKVRIWMGVQNAV